MSYLIQKSYRVDKQVLFNACGTNSLYGAIIKPENLTAIAGFKRILAGTFLDSNGGVLKRALTLSPYTAGDATVIVNNPFAFAIGDVLYEIGDDTENMMAENTAVNTAAQIFGTVTAIDTGLHKQSATVTPASVAIGDIYFVSIDQRLTSFTATTTDIADVTKGLCLALTTGLKSHHSVLDYLDIEDDGTKLTITHKEPGEIFSISSNVTGTGTLETFVEQGVGALTITPDAGNSNQDIGAKIGTIDSIPLGVITNEYYLSDNDGMDKTADLAAYDAANVYKNALVYLDGHIIKSLPTLKFTPIYGAA